MGNLRDAYTQGRLDERRDIAYWLLEQFLELYEEACQVEREGRSVWSCPKVRADNIHTGAGYARNFSHDIRDGKHLSARRLGLTITEEGKDNGRG